jgi:manganese/zinc/iron transport system permease protein
MNWTSFDTWIVITGTLCAVACALPGCFLVLRKMSMMGDAISHAVLPGLAIAFLVTGSRAGLPMFIGAAATGVLTAMLTQWINRFANVDRGAAMGVVFTTMFAVGLLLIVQAADHVDLDPGCVLYGAIEFTPLDTVVVGSMEVPRAAVVNGSVLLLNLAVITLLYKELRLASFDPGLARTLGFSPGFLHYLLMSMVAVTTVAAFESVGSIIVIAMLIVPAATAQLLTRGLVPMLVVSSLVAAASAVLGHLGAMVLPPMLGFDSTTSSGMMAFAAGILFTLAWVAGPDSFLFHRFAGQDVEPQSSSASH